jgi:hypothetical protein
MPPLQKCQIKGGVIIFFLGQSSSGYVVAKEGQAKAARVRYSEYNTPTSNHTPKMQM